LAHFFGLSGQHDRVRARHARRGTAALLALGAILRAQPAAAQSTSIELACTRLTPAQSDELVARARLLLGASTRATPRALVVECDGTSAVLRWRNDEDEKIPIDEEAGLLEGALDAIERRLAEEELPHTLDSALLDQTRPPRRPEPSRLEVPTFDPPRRRRRLPPAVEVRRRPGVGGLGLALVLASAPDPLELTYGPRLDIAAGSGSWALVLSEGFQLGAGPSFNTLIFDLRAGVAYGAPFVSAMHFGAALLGGYEWLSAYGESDGPNSLQTASSPTLTFGLRGAQQAGKTALWCGIEGIYRFEPEAIGAPFDVSLARTSLAFSAGVLLLVDAR